MALNTLGHCLVLEDATKQRNILFNNPWLLSNWELGYLWIGPTAYVQSNETELAENTLPCKQQTTVSPFRNKQTNNQVINNAMWVHNRTKYSLYSTQKATGEYSNKFLNKLEHSLPYYDRPFKF